MNNKTINDKYDRFYDDDDTPIVPIGHEDVEEDATAEDAAPMLTISHEPTGDPTIDFIHGLLELAYNT